MPARDTKARPRLPGRLVKRNIDRSSGLPFRYRRDGSKDHQRTAREICAARRRYKRYASRILAASLDVSRPESEARCRSRRKLHGIVRNRGHARRGLAGERARGRHAQRRAGVSRKVLLGAQLRWCRGWLGTEWRPGEGRDGRGWSSASRSTVSASSAFLTRA
jgi:hypothetical protein